MKIEDDSIMKPIKSDLKSLNNNTEEFLSTLSEDRLVELYQQLSYAYYNTGKPLVSDDIFDLVRSYLSKISPSHPILKSVGAHISDDDRRKERLPVWMGSLDKIKLGHLINEDSKQLERFQSRFINKHYVISDKLDGISALFVNSAGGMKLYTRGDGEYGQNISHLIPFIRGLKGIKKGSSEHFIVRGELIMERHDFEALGKGANARNVVAGLVNAKVPDLKTAKNTAFVAYELIEPVMSPSAQMEKMKRMKFNEVVWHEIRDYLTLESLSETLAQRKATSPYEIDGLVVTYDAIHEISKQDNPEYAFAFKSNVDTAEVVVVDVEWHVSKDGLIKPVVVFEPVRLIGVQIQRATGFNADFIRREKIGPGSRLLITRSGDVIPYIMRALTPSSSNEGRFPDVDFTWVGKDIKIVGDTSEQGMKQLEFFFETLSVKGIRAGTVKRLYDNGITDVKMFLDLTEDSSPLKTKWKMVKDAIDTIKGAPCIKLMHASNSFGQGFGERRLLAIYDSIPSILDKHKRPTLEELNAVEGVSNITAQKFVIGLDKFWKFIEYTGLDCNTKIDAPKGGITNVFKYQVIVFTGFRNKAWEDIVCNGGGSIGKVVTNKTTLLVAKNVSKKSGKIDDAVSKGVRVISMEQFDMEFITERG